MVTEEVLELEYSESDIAYYIDDEHGNEIGFALVENGREVEYYYADAQSDAHALGNKVNHAVSTSVDAAIDGVKSAMDDNPFVSREGVAHLKEDLNVIYKENAETISSLRSIARDMRDFKNIFTGKAPASEAQAPAPAAPAAAGVAVTAASAASASVPAAGADASACATSKEPANLVSESSPAPEPASNA